MGRETRWWIRAALATATLTLAIAACGDSAGADGAVVGGQCDSALDCAAGSDCLDGGDFPAGTCAPPCSGHQQCPDGSLCIDKKGGVCLVACASHTECRPGYLCDDKKNKSGGGESFICIDD